MYLAGLEKLQVACRLPGQSGNLFLQTSCAKPAGPIVEPLLRAGVASHISHA
jgi:hypothetical protein